MAQSVPPVERSLGFRFPEVAKDWDNRPGKNDNQTAFQVWPSNDRRCSWVCHLCHHEWSTVIKARTCYHQGCPKCFHQVRGPKLRSEAAARINGSIKSIPIIMKEFDYEENGGIDPSKISCGHRTRVSWKCSAGHKWKATPNDRIASGSGCPTCAKALRTSNNIRNRVGRLGSFADSYPQLCKSLDNSRNDKDPWEYTAGSRYAPYFFCTVCGESFRRSVYNAVTYGLSCSRCTYRQCGENRSRHIQEHNPKLTSHEKIMRLWDHPRNLQAGILPEDLLYASMVKVYLLCDVCNHSWRTTPSHIIHDRSGCPQCGIERAKETKRLTMIEKYGSVATVEFLMKDWDYCTNEKEGIFPTAIPVGTTKRCNFLCHYCGWRWKTRVRDRTHRFRTGCPKCKSSKGELAIAYILDRLGVIYQKECSYPWCCGDKARLRFDFSVYHNDTLVGLLEYNGVQHYEEVSFHRSQNKKDQFEKTRRYDALKQEACAKQGLPLKVISYTSLEEGRIEQELIDTCINWKVLPEKTV